MEGYRLPESDDALLEECDVDVFCSSGPGGQNVNRRETAVRLRHRPTGVVVSCQDERSQLRNKVRCLERLRERLTRLVHRRKPRVSTATPARVHRKRLKAKHHRAGLKAQRRRPASDE
ncbi:MAG: ribosome-associated protein [Candidatus Sumerlaeota bacterium]|nr:ribosome-associated protein [Candidatus Sumerlaeota bacterium]